MLVPMVIESSSRGARLRHLLRLLKERSFPRRRDRGPRQNLVIAQLLFLESEDPGATSACINSPGGVVTAGLAIYDTMQYVRAPSARSASAWPRPWRRSLPAAGKRYALPNSRIMIHQGRRVPEIPRIR